MILISVANARPWRSWPGGHHRAQAHVNDVGPFRPPAARAQLTGRAVCGLRTFAHRAAGDYAPSHALTRAAPRNRAGGPTTAFAVAWLLSRRPEAPGPRETLV